MCMVCCWYRPLFVKRQKEAAEKLDVSMSTLKRACKALGIGRWPWRANKSKEGEKDNRVEGGGKDKESEEENDSDTVSESEAAGGRQGGRKRRRENPEMEGCSSTKKLPSRRGGAGGGAAGDGAAGCESKVVTAPKRFWRMSQHALDMMIRLKHHGQSLHPRWAETPTLVTWDYSMQEHEQRQQQGGQGS